MFSQQEIEILHRIGQIILKENNNDYRKTNQLLIEMQITSILFFKDELVISLRRPGLLIGPRGKLINAISHGIDKHIKIHEDTSQSVYDWLYQINIDEEFE